MKSLADELPPEIAQQVDPDWRKNETAYLAVRDQLLSHYKGLWIGFANGGVIASGTGPVAAFHAAEAAARSPFVTCVGRENEPVLMRRASFAYDGAYPREPLGSQGSRTHKTDRAVRGLPARPFVPASIGALHGTH